MQCSKTKDLVSRPGRLLLEADHISNDKNAFRESVVTSNSSLPVDKGDRIYRRESLTWKVKKDLVLPALDAEYAAGYHLISMNDLANIGVHRAQELVHSSLVAPRRKEQVHPSTIRANYKIHRTKAR